MKTTKPTYCSTAPVSSLATLSAFSAKERDVETGLSYFGARYYSSDLSLWLSVDPMSDKYPSMSPYVYCVNNPVKLVDPNGEEIDPESTPLWNKMKDDSYFVVRAKTNMKYKIVKWKLYLICMLLLANICISSAQDVVFYSFYNDNTYSSVEILVLNSNNTYNFFEIDNSKSETCFCSYSIAGRWYFSADTSLILLSYHYLQMDQTKRIFLRTLAGGHETVGDSVCISLMKDDLVSYNLFFNSTNNINVIPLHHRKRIISEAKICGVNTGVIRKRWKRTIVSKRDLVQLMRISEN